MSAGDLEDFGSPLPSYPTLPSSPPKSGQQYQDRLVWPPTDSTPHATTLPSSSGPLGSSHPGDPLPSEWGTSGSSVSGLPGMDPVVASKQGPFTAQQPMQLYTQPLRREAYPLPSSPDSSYRLSSSITLDSPNVPVYATVKKPAHGASMQHSNSARQRTTSGSPSNLPLGGPTQSLAAASPGGSSNTLALRMRHLEELCGKLSREKSEMAEEFGRQRKSFMNQMAHCEGELSLYKHTAEKYTKEVQELSEVVLNKDEELQNVTIAAGITEATIRERFDADRIKYEEEIASLTKIVSGEL